MENSLAHQSPLLGEFRAAHPPCRLDLDGRPWRYIAAGDGQRTIVLLPGAFVGAEMWLHLITAWQARYRILAPDHLPKTLTLDRMNAALIQLLDHEETCRAVVIGYSAGGGFAQAFAQAHPERVQALVLSHCTPLSADTAQRMARMAGLVRLLPLPFIRAVFRRRSRHYPVTSEWADVTRAFFAERVATLQKEDLLEFVRSAAEAARAFQFDGRVFRNWNGRILLMSSKDDGTTFPRLPEMRRCYPAARVHIFEQGGHHTLLLFPEIYRSVLERFLEGVWTGPASCERGPWWSGQGE